MLLAFVEMQAGHYTNLSLVDEAHCQYMHTLQYRQEHQLIANPAERQLMELQEQHGAHY